MLHLNHTVQTLPQGLFAGISTNLCYSDSDDDGNAVPRSPPQKKISIQEKLKAFEAPPLTSTQKFRFKKLN